MTVTYTQRLRIPKPDFNTSPWQQDMASALDLIDKIIYNALLDVNTAAWQNSKAYTVGMMAVEPTTGGFYMCAVAHTSAASPTTFATDRTNNPTYWTPIRAVPPTSSTWATATAYNAGDYVVNSNKYYICNVAHTSGTFATDLAAGKWSVLVDITQQVTDAQTAATNAAASATSAANSYDSFDDRYLGAKASAPTLDNDGNPLVAGALYFDTTLSAMRYYNGASWSSISTSAPSTVDYLVKTADGGLSAERVVTDSAIAGGVVFDWATAGQVKALLRASATDKFLYSTGANAWAEGAITAAGRALLDDAAASDQRTTLGLGTAATKNTGTAIGNVVEMIDSGGTPKLPGVDGSLLTNVTGSAFPAGTRMLFQQTSAPTGWTKDTTHNDKALRVVSGTVGSGGSVAFSTVFGRTATDGHTLTIAQIPAHSHPAAEGQFVVFGSLPSTEKQLPPTADNAKGNTNTGNTGGGGSHSHNIDLRVNYVDIIIASKDA